MTRTLLVTVFLAVVCLGNAGAARADKASAKRFTELGTTAYKIGHFQEALDAYSRAYEAFPAPLLLFNLGQCHRELGNFEQALFFLRGYLHESPRAKNRALVESLIAESEAKLTAQRAEARRREEEEKQRQENEVALLAQRPLVIEQVQPSVDRHALEDDLHSGETWRTIGLFAAGAGLAAVGVGIYFGTVANSDANTVTSRAGAKPNVPWTPSDAATFNDGQRAAQLANVLFVAGGAVAAVGTAMTILGWRQAALSAGALSAAPVPGGGTIQLRGNF